MSKRPRYRRILPIASIAIPAIAAALAFIVIGAGIAFTASRSARAEIAPHVTEAQVLMAAREMLEEHSWAMYDYLGYKNCTRDWEIELAVQGKTKANLIAMRYNAYMLEYGHLITDRPVDVKTAIIYIP